MTDQLDAVTTSAEIVATYKRYLGSVMSLADPVMDRTLRQALEQTRLLTKGPFLEATPPYAPSQTLRQLVDEGVLHPDFTQLDSAELPLDRPLYTHQATAIRKAAAGRSLVVATGTGSGKTESFMLPLLDSLIRERAAGTLGPGVRALLLYPMNALANDQVKRLRQLLAQMPDITFGRYTGDTLHTAKDARAQFQSLNPGEPLLPNELISRDEIRAAPPHILLTNYAMLEYLLLRPLDMVLFPSNAEHTWRWIIVDEAHVYDGAQGSEVAMLLRRLRGRVAPGRALQCIATSATVGGDADPGAVTEFATRLLGSQLEWVHDDPARQDLVRATRVVEEAEGRWGPLSASQIHSIVRADDPSSMVLDLAGQHGITGTSAADALSSERRLARLREQLLAGPQTLRALAQAVFPDEGDDGEAALGGLVQLASELQRADGSPVLSARYHLFLRATEGAYACFSPSGPHIQLSRHERCPDCSAAAFEMGSCTRCGAMHLVGAIDKRGKELRFRHRKAGDWARWLLVSDAPELVDEDELAAADDGGSTIKSDSAVLCIDCGSLSAQATRVCPDALCGSAQLRIVHTLTKGGAEVDGCVACGARGPATLRLLETGTDAAPAVVASSLYQRLPVATDLDAQAHPGEGRKLLVFSDSRQGAAYFAPYLEDSYARLQRRRLLTQGLHRAQADREPASVGDIVFTVKKAAADAHIFSWKETSQQQDKTVAPWVMAEAVLIDHRQSLEGVGLLRIELLRNPTLPAPAPLSALGLDDDESWALLQELARTIRTQGAISMPDSVAPADEIFSPRRGPIYVRETGSEAKSKVLSWLPSKGRNRRVDYLERVLAALGKPADVTALLKGIWTLLSSDRMGWLTATSQPGLGVVHQLDHELLRFSLLTETSTTWRCSQCRRTTRFSVRGVCPALRCDGTLEPYAIPELVDDADHYRAIYRAMNPVKLSVIEHTAQWNTSEAARIQQQFVRGEVNALSCSTTFELGVDVGELQSVFLRNMPPTTANYVQRAGRAGRRTGAAALVVSYAQRRSHDLTKFNDPVSTMAGEVRTPYTVLTNERIDRRHAHSVALAAYFRRQFEQLSVVYRRAGEFFNGGAQSPAVGLRAFLSPVPADVHSSLRAVLPEEVHDQIGLEGGSWVDLLMDLLDKVQAEYRRDVDTLEELQEQAAASKNYGLAKSYQRVQSTLEKRDLLGFLGAHNVLPKYGFPVDTVDLSTWWAARSNPIAAQLRLSRDLSQAIYEYAPGASTVAGGWVWTSAGVQLLPGRGLENQHYRVCEACEAIRTDLKPVEPGCPTCGHVDTGSQHEFVIPEFGFVASSVAERPGSKPPRRSYKGGTFVLKYSDEPSERTIALPGGTVQSIVGPRGRLLALADGTTGLGFWLCEWCGFAVPVEGPLPRKHKHPAKSRECSGPLKRKSLGHRFETDLLRIDLDLHGHAMSKVASRSVLYATLEAASAVLEIARDEIDGTTSPRSVDDLSLVLYDTVPGGAGNVIRIEQELETVLEAALRRVSDCECGEETSCYSCLRSYSNQRHHDQLSRGDARQALGALLGKP